MVGEGVESLIRWAVIISEKRKYVSLPSRVPTKDIRATLIGAIALETELASPSVYELLKQ